MARSDSHLPKDVRDLAEVAALLAVDEFMLFRLAWARWHGGEAAEVPEETVEPAFGRYLETGDLPPWVRHFLREALRLRDEERFDPVALGVTPSIRRHETLDGFDARERLLVAVGWAAAILAFVVFL